MFWIFFSFSFSVNNIGVFQDINKPEDQFYVNATERFEKVLTISTGSFNGSRSEKSYFRCTVHVTGATKFTDCFAFGAGFTFGSGGAIYLSASNLLISDKVEFESNKAMVGGAVSCIGSSAYLMGNTVFKNNSAYKQAGAMFICKSQKGLKTELDKPNQEFGSVQVEVSIMDTNFTDNYCDEECGANLFAGIDVLNVMNCVYSRNIAGSTGGAVVLHKSSGTFYKCKFFNNKCGKEGKLNNMSANIFKHKETERFSPRRGGGAILMISLQETPSQLNTRECCFYGNLFSQEFAHSESSGHDILLYGNCTYTTTEDKFKLSSDLSFAFRNSFAVSILEFNSIYSDDMSSGLCSGYEEQTSQPLPTPGFTITSISEATEEDIPTDTAEVDPTPMFTVDYVVETPNETLDYKLPTINGLTPFQSIPPVQTLYQTHALTPENTVASTPEITPEITLDQTLLETPFSSPEITVDQTLLETPFSSPEITLDQTLLETPFSSPEITLDQTLLETPVSTPETTLDQTPKESSLIPPTPEISPEATLDFTIPETPLETPVSTPETTIDQTLLETPVSTPETTPDQTLLETPVLTPETTLDQTLLETPVSTPETTLDQTPKESSLIPPTPEISPEATLDFTIPETPLETPVTTPEITLDQTLHETPVSTPEITLDQTLHETPVSTPETTLDQTLHETPVSTPETTLDQTLLETPVSTPETTLDQTPLETLGITVDQTPASSPQDSPYPSNFPTEKNTVEATLMNTHAQTPFSTPAPSMTMRKDQTITYINSQFNITSETVSYISTFVNSNYSFTTATFIDNTISYIIVVTMSGDYSALPTIIVQTFQTISQFPSFALNEGTSNTEDSDSINLILIIAGALLLLLISGILIYFFVISDNNNDSTGSCQEMNEETVVIVEDSPSIAVTNDNPLWTTSIMGDTDDPFRDDFEEDPDENILQGLASRV